MKYLCLITVEEKMLNDMSKNEWDPAGSEALANDEEFRKRGHCIIAPALPPRSNGRDRAGRERRVSQIFAETEEQTGGFSLINAGGSERDRPCGLQDPWGAADQGAGKGVAGGPR